MTNASNTSRFFANSIFAAYYWKYFSSAKFQTKRNDVKGGDKANKSKEEAVIADQLPHIPVLALKLTTIMALVKALQ